MRSAQSNRSAKQLVANDNLTDQQRRFVAEYLQDNNATQAAIRAGCSAASASQLGYQLLQKPSVIDVITEQQIAQMSHVLILADIVLTQMCQLATFDALKSLVISMTYIYEVTPCQQQYPAHAVSMVAARRQLTVRVTVPTISTQGGSSISRARPGSSVDMAVRGTYAARAF